MEKFSNNLGIGLRFIKEEPSDLATRYYNETILPQYGVDYHIVPRKKIDGEIISAPKIRELLSNNRYDKLKKFVLTTYQICICKDNWYRK